MAGIIHANQGGTASATHSLNGDTKGAMMEFPFCEWVVVSLAVWVVAILGGLAFLVFGLKCPRRR